MWTRRFVCFRFIYTVLFPRNKIPLNVERASPMVETERFSRTFSASVEKHWNGSITLPVWMEFEERVVRSEWCVRGDEKGAYPEFTPRHFALALTSLIESWTGNRPFPSFSTLPPGGGGGCSPSLSCADYIRNGKWNGKGFVCLFLRSILWSICVVRIVKRKKEKKRKTRRERRKKYGIKYRNEIIRKTCATFLISLDSSIQ